ncbi:MAG: MBL fold metallo-hydrolase [Treponema sp.]|nr:MBL fold metallo-hydrolase [Treponema sp.]
MSIKIHRLVTGPFQINTWVIQFENSSAIIIDPAASEFTGDEHKISSFLSQNNLTPLAFILTHGHFDHIAGTRILKNQWPEVPLICHKEDCFMCGSSAFQIQSEILYNMGLDDFSPALKELPDPDIQVTGDPSLLTAVSKSNKNASKLLSDWQILHTPGHTQGSMCIYNTKEKLLFSGDTIFYHSYGRTDLEGGDQNQMLKSLSRIYKSLPDECLIFPGHDHYGFTLKENKF